ncbi:hypothetical protein [Bdellovibrio sp. HCB2-146]|uniref:hypothetical protein n=1 Tax=Bdellovibrio sp. HCB2-146 TaxID=3394362 RepID=UPI0039BD7DCC
MLVRLFVVILALNFGGFAEAGNPKDPVIKVQSLTPEHGAEIKTVLSLIQNIRLSNRALPDRYNLNIVGDDFWTFFSKRIHTIEEVSADNEHCVRGAMAFVEQSEKPNVASVCPVFFDSIYSRYEKASVLLHEAHHTEGHNHVMCLAGNKAGSFGGCDESIKDRGAYAVTIETLAKMILRGIGIPEEDRAQLRFGLLEALDSFNQTVGGIGNSALYLQSLDGKKAYFFDGARLHAAPLYKGQKILSRVLSVLAVPHNKQAITGIDIFSRSLRKVPPQGLCALEYNAGKTRSKLVDLMNDGPFSLCVYEKGLVGRISFDQDEDSSAEWPFKAVQVLSAEELGLETRDSVFVKSARGEFYQVKSNGSNKFEVKRQPDPTQGFQQLFYFNSDLTGLRRDGQLMKVDFETNQWIPYPGIESMRFKYSTRPFLWSHDLVEEQ